MPFDNPKESGKPVSIKDEGITLTPRVSSIDFVGAGVTVTTLGNDVTVTIPGASSSISFSNNEVPSRVDGVVTVVTWAHTPLNGVVVAVNGSTVSTPGNDYTTVGNTTTFTSLLPPDAIIIGSYAY